MLQIEVSECGAVALGIISAHYGLWLSLEDLRVRCGVSRDGSRASSLVSAGKDLGFHVTAFRGEPEALHTLDEPAILHWGFDHFLVLEEYRDGFWHLNDPARGRRRVNDREFRDQFTGIILKFTPGPKFQPSGAPPSAVRALMERLRGSHWAVALACITSILLVIPGVLSPAFRRMLMDQILSMGLIDWLWPLMGVMLATGVFSALATWLQITIQHKLETRLAIVGGISFMQRALCLPMSFFEQRSSASVADRVMLNDRVASMLAGEIGGNVMALVMALSYLGVMFLLNGQMGLIALFSACILAAGLFFVSHRLEDGQQILLNEQGLAMAEGKQGLSMIEVYRASGTERLLLDRMLARQARVMNLKQALMLGRAALRNLPMLVTGLASAATLGTGGLLIVEGRMSLGELIAFQFLLASFLSPVGRLVQIAPKLHEFRASLRLLDDTLHHPTAEEFQASPSAPAVIRRLRGGIELCDVTFGYSRRAPPLITGLSLRIRPGERVGIVGGSGSGKSTLAMLAAGLHEPWSGQVLLDGELIRSIPRETLRQSLQVVTQSIATFTGTIRENITLWDGTISNERLQQAARDAVIHDFIMERSEGYESRMFAGGSNLSGGQRARLEIARALVQDPRILIMDEATAALDYVTEADLLKNLRRRGSTVLTIAHRKSAIRDCDRVVVMERGRIVEDGSIMDLTQRDSHFARIMLADT